MTATISRVPLSDRLTRSRVIAVLRARHASGLARVCDVLVEEGILSLLRGPFPDLHVVPSGGVDLEASKQWLAAGAAAVSIGGPLLGDAFAGGNPSELRDRCRAVRAVVAEATAR